MVKVNGKSTRQKPKGKRPRPTPARPKRDRQEKIPPAMASNPYALARMDPWDPRAKGAKVPDFDNNYSAALSFNYDTNITVTAAGAGCIVLPFWPSNTYQYGTISGSKYLLTGGKGTLPQSGAMFSGWDECTGLRVVGAGVKVSTQLNTNNATGRVYLCPMSISEMRAWAANPTDGYTESDLIGRKGVEKRTLSDLAAGTDLKFTSSILDPSAFVYTEPGVDVLSAANDAADLPNYVGLVAIVQSAPGSVNAVEFSVVVHYEFIPGKNFAYMAGPPAYADTPLLEKVNRMAEQTPRIMDSVGNIAGNIFKAVKTGISIAGTVGLL